MAKVDNYTLDDVVTSEYHILKQLQGSKYIPYVFEFDQIDLDLRQYSVMIMDKLGPSLGRIFKS